MIDPYKTYSITTELTPQKIVLQDPDSGKLGEHDLNRGQRQAALNRAHEIRKFEIELYWKRATYFWVLQAAVFAAIGFIWKTEEIGISPVIPVAIAALGFVTSVAGVLSAKGSKFWQENWEHHIDMLEDEFEGRLHKTAYVGKDGLARSVSGVNDRLAICFAVFWMVILIATIGVANPGWVEKLPDCLEWMTSSGVQTVAILIATALAGFALYRRKTNFVYAKGVPYHRSIPLVEGTDILDEEKLPSVDELATKKKPFLIRREPKV